MPSLRIETIKDEPAFRGRMAELSHLHERGMQEVVGQTSSLDSIFNKQLGGMAMPARYSQTVVFGCAAEELTAPEGSGSDREALPRGARFLGYSAIRSGFEPVAGAPLEKGTLAVVSFVVDRSHPENGAVEASLIGAMNDYMDSESDKDVEEVHSIFIDVADKPGLDNFSTRLHGQFSWKRGESRYRPKPSKQGINRHWNSYRLKAGILARKAR